MGAIATASALLTPAEYLAWEEKQAERHECYEGEVLLMAGGSKIRNKLTLNLATALRAAVGAQGCEVFAADVKLAAHDGSFYTYPDVMLTCDPADQQDPYLVRRPQLIAEVLSPATEEFDRVEKFTRYRQLPSLRHYLLLSQGHWTAEWLRRDEAGQWIYTPVKGADAVLAISDLNLQLPLAELYAATDVASTRPRAA